MKTSFIVFENRMIGREVKAVDIYDLIYIKMTMRQKKLWTNINFIDEFGRFITVNREFIDEQDMSIQEVINDWIQFNEDELQNELSITQ